MTKLVFIHPDLYESHSDAILLDSFNDDVFSLQYTPDLTNEQLYEIIQESHTLSQISQIAFLYHYPGYEILPFFPDTVSIYDEQLQQSKYRYFSDNVINIIKAIRDAVPRLDPFIVDILSCDLNTESYKNEVSRIETELNITIRYSTDKTGNPSSGANWVLESNNVNVRDVYFTDNILEWSGVLTTDISTFIKNGSLSEFITFDVDTYTLQKDFAWSELIAQNSSITNTSFIHLLAGEIFDGTDKKIDLETITGWQGLITSAVTNSSSVAPIIKNLGITNGTTVTDGGFIIRRNQRFFLIENSYSTGTIANQAGGIVGRESGGFGSCTVKNCFSIGNIGGGGGGIGGFSVGIGGNCIIENCYSTGIIGGNGGGITGIRSGSQGSCTIENCYSTGALTNQAGGITGRLAAFGRGVCNIINCYSIGIIANEAGGIAGIVAGADNGSCNITNCYSIGKVGTGGGGIVSQFAANTNGSCIITNCVSQFPINGSAPQPGLSINNSSTELLDLATLNSNTALSIQPWDKINIWNLGGALEITLNNNSLITITLPILLLFKITPWLANSYVKANDGALFEHFNIEPITDLVPYDGDGYIRLAWTPPTVTGGNPILLYEIDTYITAGNTFVSTTIVPHVIPTGNPTLSQTGIVTGLTNGINYTFQVRMKNTGNAYSPFVNALKTPTAIDINATISNFAINRFSLSDYFTVGAGKDLDYLINLLDVRAAVKANTTLTTGQRADAVASYIISLRAKYASGNLTIPSTDTATLQQLKDTMKVTSSSYNETYNVAVFLPNFNTTYGQFPMAIVNIEEPDADQYYHFEVPDGYVIQLTTNATAYVTLQFSFTNAQFTLLDQNDSIDPIGKIYSLNSTINVGNLTVQLYGIGSLIVGQGSGGGGGDPYMTTVYGVHYKLPLMEGFIRYYQGMVEGKLLTINARLRKINNTELFDSNIRGLIDHKSKAPEKELMDNLNSAFNDHDLNFFEKLYIEYDGNSMTLNIWDGKLRIEEYKGHMSMKACKTPHIMNKCTNVYKNVRSSADLKIIFSKKAVLYLSLYDWPLVRNAIYLVAPNMTTGNGVIVNALSKYSMTIPELKTTRAVPKFDAVRFNEVEEYFLDEGGYRRKKVIVTC